MTLLLPLAAGAAEPSGERLKGFKLPHYADDGRLTWVVESAEISQAPDRTVKLLKPKVTTYKGKPREEKQVVVIQANEGRAPLKEGELFPSSPNVHLSGGCIVSFVGESGKVEGSLSCESMDWDGTSKVATGKGETTLSFGESSLKGSGFTFGLEEEKMVLVGDVSGRLVGMAGPLSLAEEAPPVELSCSGPAVFLAAEKVLELQGGVEARSGEGRLSSDWMRLQLGGERKLESLEGKGNVRFTSPAFSGTGDAVEWDGKEIVRLSGEPLELSAAGWRCAAKRAEYAPATQAISAEEVTRLESEGADGYAVSFERVGALKADRASVTLSGRPVVSGVVGGGSLAADEISVRRGEGATWGSIEGAGDVALQKEGTRLAAGKMGLSLAEHRLEAGGGVALERAGSSVHSETMTFLLDEANKSMVSGEAQGGVEIRAAAFAAWGERARWEGGGGVLGLDEQGGIAGKVALEGNPRVEARNVGLPATLSDSGTINMKAETITLDAARRVVEALGGAEAKTERLKIEAGRMELVLEEAPSNALKAIDAGGGVRVTSGETEAEADSLEADARGEASVRLAGNVRLSYPVTWKDYTGRALVKAAGEVKWEVGKGKLELRDGISISAGDYGATGDRAEAAMGPQAGAVESVSIYGKPAVVTGANFEVPAEEVTFLSKEPRLVLKKASRGKWQLKGKGGEGQPGQKGAEGR